MSEIREGYKQTKVGVIPEEWEALPAINYFKKSIAKGYDGLEIYSVTLNVSWQKRSNLEREIGSDVDIDKSLLAEEGDLVYNTMRMWQGALGLAENTGVVSPAYIVLKPKKDKIDSKFAFYQLKSYRYLHYLKSYSYGLTSDRLRLYFKDFGMIPFVCPPLKEQQKIAQILSIWDDAISKQEQLIEAKERLKKGLMQKLLSGEVRFAGFDGEWEEVRLGDIATFYKGKGISKNDISDEGIECIRYGELYTKYGEKIENIFSKTSLGINDLFLSEENDILIPASGETAIDIATASCVIKDGIVLSGDINVIRTKENGIFLSYYLNVIAKTKIASLAQGISVIHLYQSQLKSLKIKLPPKEEQQKIAQVLTIADKEIELLKKELEALKEQKRGLMQRLLTGEVRVKIDEGERK